jgi:uncharacterized membrane protein
MWFLALGCAFFTLIHLVIVNLKIRDQIIDSIGKVAYLILFALLSLIGLVWMIFGYSIAMTDENNVTLYHSHIFFHFLALLPMFLAFNLFIMGYLTPMPKTIEALKSTSIKPIVGILRISRHPILAGIAIWSLIHLLLAGNFAGIVFFGTLLATTLIGANSIDQKRLKKYGETYRLILNRTSFMPFYAIIEGRNVFLPPEFGVLKPVLSLSMFCMFLALHEILFAVSVL